MPLQVTIKQTLDTVGIAMNLAGSNWGLKYVTGGCRVVARGTHVRGNQIPLAALTASVSCIAGDEGPVSGHILVWRDQAAVELRVCGTIRYMNT